MLRRMPCARACGKHMNGVVSGAEARPNSRPKRMRLFRAAYNIYFLAYTDLGAQPKNRENAALKLLGCS